jgi:2-methylcitrate dehydratase
LLDLPHYGDSVFLLSTQIKEMINLSRRENQARLVGQYALDMIRERHAGPGEAVLDRVEAFFRDSMACGISALAGRANAPAVLLQEAVRYASLDRSDYVPVLGRPEMLVPPEKAVAAAASAVREWDANGTNFGYNPELGATAGEFGHNDFYPVVLAGAHQVGLDGRQCLVAMAVLDEIRGRLAEVFALRKYKIDHVLHGAIASAAVYGAILGATAEQIESAIGLVVAHYVPFRAIRAGEQLSDSKGASAALAAETAVLAVHRARAGFIGPGDVFRNPQAVFCLYEPPLEPHASPFDLHVATEGDDFAVMGMHFKLGLYEHQSAGAIGGMIELLGQHPEVLQRPDELQRVMVTIYEPAYSIISDPAKRNPQTRQSADHSMYYIVATLLRKAFQCGKAGWAELMLLPEDYSDKTLADPLTRRLMKRIEVRHGGPEYDARYPDGIPTTVELEHARLGSLSSGLVMYPEGHARCSSGRLQELLGAKFRALVRPAVADIETVRRRLTNLRDQSRHDILRIYDLDEISACSAESSAPPGTLASPRSGRGDEAGLES